jgi:hypothetical protein
MVVHKSWDFLRMAIELKNINHYYERKVVSSLNVWSTSSISPTPNMATQGLRFSFLPRLVVIMRYDRETRSLPPRTIPTEYMGETPPVPRRATSLKVPKRLSDVNFFLQPKKSNLKIKTAKMSLQSNWESSSSMASEKKQVKWMIVEIRHYDRVVGDNPSCSSGPPLRYVGKSFVGLNLVLTIVADISMKSFYYLFYTTCSLQH